MKAIHAVLPVAIALLLAPTVAQAQTFKLPKRGAPASTVGGATRGNCSAKSKSLVSLIPQPRLGLTLSERPTFLWAVPSNTPTTAQLTILGDKDTKVVYETAIALPKTSGVVKFTLPPEAPALEVGKQYHWFLSINCKPDGSGNEVEVDGWVERIAPTSALTRSLKTADAAQQVKLYAEAGIWHEAVSTLATLRLNQPKNAKVAANWRELLRSAGLSSIMNEPLVGATQLSRR
jgi:hypothetical protein